MTMNFIIVKDALIALLGTEAASRYRTIGFQQQGQSAEEIKDTDRSVQVFYSEGTFPKSGGSLSGPYLHKITIRIELAISEPARGDLATLNNPSATPSQLATAIAAMQDAAQLADNNFDELVDIIFNIIMSAENVDLGLSTPIGTRWIDSVKKNQPLPRGEYIVLTGEMLFTCVMDEQATGAASTTGEGIGTEVEIDEDTTGKAGVEVDITEP
jgi:hypothetical protein